MYFQTLARAAPRRRRNRRRVGPIDEIRLTGRIEELARNHRLDAAVAAQRGDMVQQIARMAGAEWTARRTVMPPLKIRDHHLMEGEVALVAVGLEDAGEL